MIRAVGTVELGHWLEVVAKSADKTKLTERRAAHAG